MVITECALPTFALRPEGIGDRLAALFGGQDIDFPDRPDFSRRYRLTRHGALWQAERAGRPQAPLFKGKEDPVAVSPLPEMTLGERLESDLLRTGITVGPHPILLHHPALCARGVRRAAEVLGLAHGTWVRVGER